MRLFLNFLKSKTSWSNTEIGLLKVCLVSLGMTAGILFHKLFKEYVLVFAGVFFLTGVWALFLWIKKMKER